MSAWRRKRSIFPGLAALLCWAAMAPGAVVAVEPTGGGAGAFLTLGTDARLLGWGGAGVAVAGEASAAYWNPAGLASLERLSLLAAYSAFPRGGGYSQFVFALPLAAFGFPADETSGSLGSGRWGGLAITLLRLAVAHDIEARRLDTLNPDFLFSDTALAYSLAYGVDLGRGWQAGLGLKGLDHQVGLEQAQGWGVDTGVAWEVRPGLRLAAMVRDTWTVLHWSTGHQEIFPVTVTLGSAYEQVWPAGHQLGVYGDASARSLGWAVGWRAGAEYSYAQTLFLRSGYADGYLALGAGVRVPSIGWGRAAARIDYALVQDRITDWDHWVSLKIDF